MKPIDVVYKEKLTDDYGNPLSDENGGYIY